MGIDGIDGLNGKPPVERKPSPPQDPNPRPSNPTVVNTDHVQFSEQTQQITRVRKLAQSAPEIRHERVDRLKREISRGTYHVSGEKIADAIVEEHKIDYTA